MCQLYPDYRGVFLLINYIIIIILFLFYLLLSLLFCISI